MAIAPFLPGIFFFWSPSIIMTPALSADSCPVLHGSVRGRVIAFFAGGGGGVGRRSLRRLTVRPNENTQRSNLSPGVVVDAADASYSSSGEPSELNMTVAVAVLLRRPAGGAGRVRVYTAHSDGRGSETALLMAARLHLFFGPRAEEGPRPDRPRAAEKGASNTTTPRLPASIEDQVGERRRGAIGFIIASSKPSTPSYLERCLDGRVHLHVRRVIQPASSQVLGRAKSR